MSLGDCSSDSIGDCILPRVIITLKDSETGALVTDQGVTVSVQQDKWFEGFKEIFAVSPDPVNGTVNFEATSATKYRISAGGLWYNNNETLVDTGGNFFFDIKEVLWLDRKTVPTPNLNPFSWTRDIGLAQQMPFVIMLVAIAVIVGAIAYGISQVTKFIPKRKGEKQIEQQS